MYSTTGKLSTLASGGPVRTRAGPQVHVLLGRRPAISGVQSARGMEPGEAGGDRVGLGRTRDSGIRDRRTDLAGRVRAFRAGIASQVEENRSAFSVSLAGRRRGGARLQCSVDLCRNRG